MICPVCERDNGDLVMDPGVGGGVFPMCVPCQRVADIVEAAPLDAFCPLTIGETVGEWMRRLQDELAEQIKDPT